METLDLPRWRGRPPSSGVRGWPMPGVGPNDLPMSVQALKDRQAGRFSEADVNGDSQLDVGEMQALSARTSSPTSWNAV